MKRPTQKEIIRNTTDRETLVGNLDVKTEKK